MFKYVEDVDWLEAFKENKCPYENCSGHIQKKGIKRECNNCQLTVYGNPLILGYKAIEIIIKTSVNVECTHEKRHYDRENKELVCMICGEVLAGSPCYVGGDLRVTYEYGYIWDDTCNSNRLGDNGK